jgi:glycogen synthase
MGHFLEVFNNKKCLATMRRQAMARRVGWSEAAMRYASLYERVLEDSKRPAT